VTMMMTMAARFENVHCRACEHVAD